MISIKTAPCQRRVEQKRDAFETDHNNDTPQDQRTNTHKQDSNSEQQTQCDTCAAQDQFWGDNVEALGKGKGIRGGPDSATTLEARAHLQADRYFKHVPQDQTRMGYDNKSIYLGH